MSAEESDIFVVLSFPFPMDSAAQCILQGVVECKNNVLVHNLVSDSFKIKFWLTHKTVCCRIHGENNVPKINDTNSLFQ